MKRNLKFAVCSVLLILSMLLCACDGAVNTPDDTQEDTTVNTESTNKETQTTQGPQEKEPFSLDDLDLRADALQAPMKNLFAGQTVENETVMFLDYGDEKTLLYDFDEILSVTSYDGKTVYTEGTDYIVRDGKLVCPAGSSIPVITREVYYGAPDTSYLMTEYNGQNVYTYWGEGTAMTRYHVNVNYTHKGEWEGFRQPCRAEIYRDFINKLKAGEDVVVFFYGDSITAGGNASFNVGIEPYQLPYSMLFCEALADLFGYNVHYVDTGLEKVTPVPQDHDNGSAHTITYINTAVGGWNSNDGYTHYEQQVESFIDQYGCDLFVCAFGMNDGGMSPAASYNYQSRIVSLARKQCKDAAYLYIATMMPNPNATNGWYGTQPDQEAFTLDAVEKFYPPRGIACSVCQVGSVSKAILERKEFYDYSANNINHPNDFFMRVYAQTMLQTVIGYENIH